MSLDYLSVRVTRVIEETADSRSLEFELPEALAERLRYRPGQFLTLRVPYQGVVAALLLTVEHAAAR